MRPVMSFHEPADLSPYRDNQPAIDAENQHTVALIDCSLTGSGPSDKLGSAWFAPAQET
jgi:hypothetical protein